MFEPMKIVGSEDFGEPSFPEMGAKFSSLSGVLVQQQAFRKGDGSHPLYHMFVLVVVGGCYY